ncbi:GNAT family N-acetyltransferase [Bowmanella dokdonensis]
MLVISGEPDWAISQAQTVLYRLKLTCHLWVGEGAADNIQANQYRQYLGREYQALIYNAFDGLRASALAALSGAVLQSGLMILLCPDLQEWPTYQDPQKAQRISYGYLSQASHSHFVAWLIQRINNDPAVAFYSKEGFNGTNVPLLPFSEALQHSLSKTATQQKAVDSILNIVSAEKPDALVITADRGRGKSSALGIASAQLLEQGKEVLLCAPVVSAVEQVFAMAKTLYPRAEESRLTLTGAHSSMSFQPVDRILAEQPVADILLVDEAAAIPAPLLKALCERYSKVVLSTTIHGYEGSGRGFEIRFKPYLREKHPNHDTLHLLQPIRWQQGDPLEAFWFSCLLMTKSRYQQVAVPNESISYQWFRGKELVHSPELLHQAFELLVNAHYQTTPDDLVRILDAPDQRLYLLTSDGNVLAAAQINWEGNKALDEIATEVVKGKRRVKGHLLPQRLGFIFKDAASTKQRYWRIVRIAVQPELQHQGLGGKLLRQIEADARDLKLDFLGSSFAASEDMLKFWQKAGYQLVHLGDKKDASSGEVSALVLNPLSKKAKQIQTRLISFSDQLS